MERERGEVRKLAGFVMAAEGVGVCVAMLYLAERVVRPHLIDALVVLGLSSLIGAAFVGAIWIFVLGIEWMLDL